MKDNLQFAIMFLATNFKIASCGKDLESNIMLDFDDVTPNQVPLTI